MHVRKKYFILCFLFKFFLSGKKLSNRIALLYIKLLTDINGTGEWRQSLTAANKYAEELALAVNSSPGSAKPARNLWARQHF
jgi:hypothetical protein